MKFIYKRVRHKWFLISFALVLIFLVACSSITHAAIAWTGTVDLNWDNDANWGGSSVDGADAMFDTSSSTYVFDLITDQIVAAAPKGIIVDIGTSISVTINDASGTGTLALTGDTKVKGSGNVLTLNVNRTGGNSKAELGGKIVIGHAGALGTGELLFKTGGSIETSLISGLNISNPVKLDKDGGGIIGGSNDITLTGLIYDGGALTIQNTGTTTIDGTVANTYKGVTNVNAGTLQVNSTSGTGPGEVFVSSGATLGGSGSIDGETTITGTLDLNHGDSLDFSGTTLQFDSGSTLAITLGTASQVIAYASLGTVSGTAGTLQITFGEGFNYSSPYTVFSGAAGIAGSGALLDSSTLVFKDADGNDITSDVTAGLDGSDNYVITIVPEPLTFAFIAGGFALLLVAMTRHRRKL